jgi:hypothetical protein
MVIANKTVSGSLVMLVLESRRVFIIDEEINRPTRIFNFMTRNVVKYSEFQIFREW